MSTRENAVVLENIPVKVGRDYKIDYWDVFEVLCNHADDMHATLSKEQNEGRESLNIEGLLDYVMAGIKSGPERILSYKDIRAFPSQTDPTLTHKRLGLLFFNKTQEDFDLVDSANKIVIERETPLIEIAIPRVDFSGAIKKILKPEMLSRSFDFIADYLTSHDPDIEFIMGLTHPRLGRLAKRWGFLMEERPFPAEIYRFMEMGLEDPEEDPESIKSLEVFKNQVLIYQPRAEFLNRIIP